MLEEWSFICPTKLYFKEDGLGEIGKIVKDEGHSRIVLLYGRSSFVKSGSLEIVTNSLKTNGIEYISFGGIEANPDIEFVRSIVKEVKDYKPDLVLACGGGSVIDTAKSLAHAYYYKGDALDFNRHNVQATKALPIGTVLTLSAAGSEMSSSCVMSERATNFKLGFNSPTNYPQFSLLIPSLTYAVSPFQTACGLVDIISHSFERYFCSSHKFELSDYLALSVIKSIVELSGTVLKNPNDYEARRNMMLCGLFSHNGWTGIGKVTKMPVHAVEHILSGQHPEIAHGQGLRVLMVEFLKINSKVLEEKILKFGSFVFNVCSVEETITSLENYFNSLPMENTLLDLGIKKDEAEQLLLRLMKD